MIYPSTVLQLAKADGCKVIASAGTDEKVAFVSSIGADVAFNYKSVPTSKILEKEGPLNMCVPATLVLKRLLTLCSYWDNVGGETLEAAITAADSYARFIVCACLRRRVTLTNSLPA